MDKLGLQLRGGSGRLIRGGILWGVGYFTEFRGMMLLVGGELVVGCILRGVWKMGGLFSRGGSNISIRGGGHLDKKG